MVGKLVRGERSAFGVNRFFQPSYPGDCSDIGQPSGETGINWGTQATVIGQTGQPANCGMPVLTIQGFTATGCCNSFPKIQGPDYTIQGIDSVSYIQGNTPSDSAAKRAI